MNNKQESAGAEVKPPKYNRKHSLNNTGFFGPTSFEPIKHPGIGRIKKQNYLDVKDGIPWNCSGTTQKPSSRN